MTKINIKASNSNMSDKQFKLSDLIPEFSKYRTIEDKKRISCQTIDNSLFTITKKGKKYLNLPMFLVLNVSIMMLLKMELIVEN